MPIKYQMLGGGGGTDLLLKVAPNIIVTLSREGYTSTLTTDEQGQALFKNLKTGTYIVKFRSESTELQNEVVVLDKQEETFGVKQVKNLPLGAKLKFSSGKTFTLLKKNAKGHPSNSATFWSDIITEMAPVDARWYFDSNVHKTILPKYYNELNGIEKSSIINREIIVPETTRKESAYFYVFSTMELGQSGSEALPKNYENMGFTYDNERIRKDKNGSAQGYFTTYFKANDYGSWIHRTITKQGKFGSYTNPEGVVPACDLKGGSYVFLDADGYYKVLKAK